MPQLGIEVPADRYAVLYRSSDLLDHGRPVAMQRGDGGPLVMADSLPASGDGFLRIALHEISNPGDLDGDGVDDITELGSPGLYNPLNHAPVIPEDDGATMILDRATYEALSHRDNFPGAADIREVKFVIFDIHTDSPDLYFVDSNKHQYHSGFAGNRGIGRYPSGGFNGDTYFSNENRKNLAGSLIAHDNYLAPNGRLGVYTVEFWPTDPVAFRFVEPGFELIAAALPFLDGQIAYHPASETQRTLLADESELYTASHVKTIATEELFGNVTYTGLNTGECFGRLKLFTGSETLSVRDLVLFQTIPNDISHVAGIITETPQTPLSHINLKARQNDTPNAFIQDASVHPDIAPLIGQDVYFSVGPDGFEIRAATPAELDDYFDSIRPSEPQVTIRDLSVTEIRPLADIGFNDSSAFGSKAANLAELRKIPSIPQDVMPDGFAIPFYFYDEFMTHNGFYADAQAMIDDPLFQSDPAVREQRLEDFRDHIKDHGVLPDWMLVALHNMHQSFPPGTSLRSRSSTNSEDLEGFNGAGLYESYTHHPHEGHFQKTAKQVWAGLWTYRAFEEREFWRIDHLEVAMGILVHPNFSDEQANGVGVTKNPYIPGPGWNGHYINVQVGEDLVTNPQPGSIPEEFTIANLTFGNDYEIQYIRFSNLMPAGETILSREQALELNGYMEDLHDHFDHPSRYDGGPDFAMEIEFKVTAEGQLAIKQARPWVD